MLLIWNIKNPIQKIIFLKILELKQKIKDFPKIIVFSFISYGIESKNLLLAFFSMIGDLNSMKAFEFCKRIIVDVILPFSSYRFFVKKRFYRIFFFNCSFFLANILIFLLHYLSNGKKNCLLCLGILFAFSHFVHLKFLKWKLFV
jgi:hypothetical protein